jgi:hypothetical protein
MRMSPWRIVHHPCGRVCLGVNEEARSPTAMGHLQSDASPDQGTENDPPQIHVCVLFALRVLNITQVLYITTHEAYRSLFYTGNYMFTLLAQLFIETVPAGWIDTVMRVFATQIFTWALTSALFGRIYSVCVSMAYGAVLSLHFVTRLGS